MQHKTIKLSLTLLLGLILTGLQAQEAVTTSGGEISGDEGTVSYSVGQVFYLTFTGTSGSVAQGVQQPYEIYAPSGIDEITGIHLTISAFPIPVTDNLILKIDLDELTGLSYQLFDIHGKLLKSNTITGNETKISMEDLSPAVYYLNVNQTNTNIKSFKIIKN